VKTRGRKKSGQDFWALCVANRKAPKHRAKATIRSQMLFARKRPVTLPKRFVPEDWQ
jgi:hypothetical protein